MAVYLSSMIDTSIGSGDPLPTLAWIHPVLLSAGHFLHSGLRAEEPLLDVSDGVRADAEALLQHLVVDGRHAVEQRRRHLLDTRVLAAQGRERQRRAFAHVELEVHQALGEHEQLALFDGGGEQRVVGAVAAHEAHVQLALGHEQQLRGARVRVRGVDAALVEVDARSRDPERVQSREVGDGGRGHGRHVLIAGVAAILEGGGGEVPHRHLVGGLAGEAVDGGEGGGVVGDAEVLQGILVGGHGQHGHERGHAHQHGHRHPQSIAAEDAHDMNDVAC